jgi:hypothetical protein
MIWRKYFQFQNWFVDQLDFDIDSAGSILLDLDGLDMYLDECKL